VGESSFEPLDPIVVATEAHIYYNKVMQISLKPPTKSLKHVDTPALHISYLLFWHDVGYADQDIEEWKPSDFALQFDGLVEEYRKVHTCITYLTCDIEFHLIRMYIFCVMWSAYGHEGVIMGFFKLLIII